MADLATQEEMAGVLREGARLLYTVAAGQYFQLGDINAWFERFNALATRVGNDEDVLIHLGDTFGVINERQAESDPVVDQATVALTDLAARSAKARDDFATAVENARQSGGA